MLSASLIQLEYASKHWKSTFSYSSPLLARVCGVGVCAWARASAAPSHSWLGWWMCLFVCALPACTPPFLAGVRGVCVCAWARVSAAPRHSWLGCWGLCVFVCALRLYPAIPGWSVLLECVCLGSGFGFAPPLLAGVLGCACLCARSACTPPLLAGVCGVGVCASARVSAAPRHPWLGCAVWVCVLGLGFRLRPATPCSGVGVCVFVCALRLYPATPGWGVRYGRVCLGSSFGCAPPPLAGVCGVGVCVWARVSAAPRHSSLGCRGMCVLVCALRLYPVTPGWAVRCRCVCLGSGLGLPPPLLAGVFGCGCVCVRAPLLPRHSWLESAVCVWSSGLLFQLRPATPGWGVRCGCVCSGSGFGCATPLLAGVLGCGCVCVRAPLVPRHSWLECAVCVCSLGLWFRLRPATPGWGVGVCVCPRVFPDCTPPLLARVCGVRVWCCLAPIAVMCFVACCARCPGLRHPVAVVAWHLSVCLGCGRRRASLACLVAPHGAPRLVRSGRSRCSGRRSRRRGAFPQPGGLRPRLYWVAARGTRRPAEAGALGSLRVVPVRGPAMGLSLAGPSGVGLGLRALRCFACVDPVTDVSGFPYRSSFDGGFFVWTSSPPFVGRRTPRPGIVHVCVCSSVLAGSGGPACRARFGAPHLFLWPLCPSALFGPLHAGLAPFVVLWLPSPPLFFFFLLYRFPRAPLVSFFLWFPAPGALGLGALLSFPPPPPACVLFSVMGPCCLGLSLVSGPGCPGRWRCVLFVLLASRSSAPRELSPLLWFPLGRWLLPGVCHASPPLFFCVSLFFSLPVCGSFFFLSFFFCFLVASPRCLWYSLVSGPGCPGPWRCVLFVLLTSRCSAHRALSPLLWFLPGRWLLLGGCCPPPPFVSRCFSRCRFVLLFFSFLLRAPFVSGFLSFPAPGCTGPWRCVLFVLLASRSAALRAPSPPLWFPPGRWLLPGGCCPPPPFLCLAVFLAAALCSVFVYFLSRCAPPLSLAFSGFRPRVPWALALCAVFLVGLPLLGSPCALASFVIPAWPLAASWCSLPPPPPFASRGFRRWCSVLCFLFLCSSAFLAACSPPPPVACVVPCAVWCCRAALPFRVACFAVVPRLAVLWAAARCAVFVGVFVSVLC